MTQTNPKKGLIEKKSRHIKTFLRIFYLLLTNLVFSSVIVLTGADYSHKLFPHLVSYLLNNNNNNIILGVFFLCKNKTKDIIGILMI